MGKLFLEGVLEAGLKRCGHCISLKEIGVGVILPRDFFNFCTNTSKMRHIKRRNDLIN